MIHSFFNQIYVENERYLVSYFSQFPEICKIFQFLFHFIFIMIHSFLNQIYVENEGYLVSYFLQFPVICNLKIYFGCHYSKEAFPLEADGVFEVKFTKVFQFVFYFVFKMVNCFVQQIYVKNVVYLVSYFLQFLVIINLTCFEHYF